MYKSTIFTLVVALLFAAAPAAAGPGINIDTEAEWGNAIGSNIWPLTTTDWGNLGSAFQANMANGEPYEFVESELWASGGGMYDPGDGQDPFELPAGMCMQWARDVDPTVDTGYIAGWKYEYGEDPNLQGQVLECDVIPPLWTAAGARVVTVGIGLVDANGATRSWTWNVGPPPAPAATTLLSNAPNFVRINVTPAGQGAAGDASHGLGPPPGPYPWDLALYADNGFDPTKCVSIVGLENGVVPPGGAIIPPPPGGYNRSVFNWWGAMSVVPEPSTLIIWSLLAALGIGLGWWRRRKAA